MSFTAFGRGFEQNGNHSNGANHNGTNGHGSSNGNGNANGHSNGNGHANGNGTGHVNGNGKNGVGNRFEPVRATLSSGVSIKGTVKFRSELVIDGEVEGTIESLGRLTVGRNGRVRGDIQTRSVTIHGRVDGNLSVDERCELRSGCTLHGDIETPRLVVDEDVNFTGNAAIATRDLLSGLRPLGKTAPGTEAITVTGKNTPNRWF